MYEPHLRADVSQGDLFLGVPLVRVDAFGGEVTTTVAERTAILLTYDCEYDKPRVDFVLMAWVRPLSDLVSGSQAAVRDNRMRGAFYLPALASQLPESFVDLYHMVPVKKAGIARLAAEGRRLASLSDEGRLALQRQIAIYFGHSRAGA